MNDPQTIVPLTEADHRLLDDSYSDYSIQWTVYKFIIYGVMIVAVGMWLMLGWWWLTDKPSSSYGMPFLVMTCAMVALGFWNRWAVPIDRKTLTTTPFLSLELDIDEDRKIQQVGRIISVIPSDEPNEYSKLLFRVPYQNDPEELLLDIRIWHNWEKILTRGREVELEYTPHAHVVLGIRLI